MLIILYVVHCVIVDKVFIGNYSSADCAPENMLFEDSLAQGCISFPGEAGYESVSIGCSSGLDVPLLAESGYAIEQ